MAALPSCTFALTLPLSDRRSDVLTLLGLLCSLQSNRLSVFAAFPICWFLGPLALPFAVLLSAGTRGQPLYPGTIIQTLLPTDNLTTSNRTRAPALLSGKHERSIQLSLVQLLGWPFWGEKTRLFLRDARK